MKSKTLRFEKYLERHRGELPKADSESPKGQPSRAGNQSEPAPPEPEKFTLDEAYQYTQSSSRNTSDLEKALRAAAFLLEWASDIGNESADPVLINGIARVLDKCASEVHELFPENTIWKLAGDPRELREKREVRHEP